MSETLVVVSKIKKMAKDAGFRTGGDYINTLSEKIRQTVNTSIEKVKTDGNKKTLGAEDVQ